MEIVNNILSTLYVVLGIFVAFVFFAIFFWAKGSMAEIETRGSSIVLAEKLLSAPCINLADTKGNLEKFIFKKSALDKYNNNKISCIDLDGSFYFVEVKSDIGTWQFNSTSTYPYAYNALARGVTKNCPSELPISTATSFKESFPSPYGYSSLKFSALINDGERMIPASVRVIADADTGTEFYPAGYPLCLCDVSCPYNSCMCAAKCPNGQKTVNYGERCS